MAEFLTIFGDSEFWTKVHEVDCEFQEFNPKVKQFCCYEESPCLCSEKCRRYSFLYDLIKSREEDDGIEGIDVSLHIFKPVQASHVQSSSGKLNSNGCEQKDLEEYLKWIQENEDN